MLRRFFRQAFGWRRLRVAFIASLAFGSLFALGWKGAIPMLYLRLVAVSLLLLLVFATLERFPPRLPGWLARWALQISGVAVAAPLATAFVYWLTTLHDAVAWFHDKDRMGGYSLITGFAVLVSPWIAMVAVYRDISGRARQQALEFDLERSRFAEQALQARMNQLQAQVEPHFLFNTLANIRELVQQGSPQASDMLESLIGYLRAAVPRLHEPASTIGRELELVRSYLSIMRMRMPDRLHFEIRSPHTAADTPCLAGSIVVLVENAVRHGIDPSEDGGTIVVEVRVEADRCMVDVEDTGVGPGGSTPGLGTGLANLAERLRLAHGAGASLTLEPRTPRGMSARMTLPAGTSHAR